MNLSVSLEWNQLLHIIMKILRRLASGLCLFSSLTMIATLIYIIINQAKDIDKKFDDLNTL